MQAGQQDVLYKLLGCFQCRPMICKKGKIIPMSNIAFLFSSFGWWESTNGCCLQTQFEEAIAIHLLLTLSPMWFVFYNPPQLFSHVSCLWSPMFFH